MDNALSLHGCVIKRRPVGDYDWLVTLLTAEKGKLNAFARYARKPGTKLCGNVEPFGFGTFDLVPGPSSYVLCGVKIDRYFESFRMDPEPAAYGSLFLEIADYYTRENLEAAQLLNLLYVSLTVLAEGREDRPNSLVRCVYELRAMVTEGVFPGAEPLMPLSGTLLKTLSHIETAPLKSLYSFTLREDYLKELEEATTRCRNMVMDRGMKSLAMIGLYEEEKSGGT